MELPEGFSLEDFDDVEVIAGNAETVLKQLIEHTGPQPFIDVLCATGAAYALKHSLEVRDCDCGAEGHFDQALDMLTESIEAAREIMRPQYLKRYEKAEFTQDVNGDLDEIEVIAEDDLEVLRRALADEE